ncbi:polyamine-modulated factor 1-like isoform X2 [Protopterus annectens]|uniref:polyamine-modulated factor 1-like isoform X2 n=1 Tax=Protopterus annectens TaxID=7888 RepID=UPI001CFB4B66|nr:polyamine-modulated factor 1-like isoform X2 [Protopterus annectens]
MLQLLKPNKNLSFQRFAHCYQSFYNLQPEVTASVHEKFLSLLQTSIQDEIDQVKEEGNLEVLFTILDRIVEESKDKKEPAWRPSGIPEEDLRSWLVPYILNQKQYLRKHHREMQEENAKLMRSVLAGREKIMELQQQIQLRSQAWQAIQKDKQQLILALGNPTEENLI